MLEPITRAVNKSVHHVAILGNRDLLRNRHWAVREVSACSVLIDNNAPRGCAPIQSSTARLGHQIRCVCASPAWLEAQQDPASTAQVGAAWWPLWLDSWRVIELPVILKASARNGTTPALPHMRHSVGNSMEGRDLTDKTLKSAQKPEKIDGETW